MKVIARVFLFALVLATLAVSAGAGVLVSGMDTSTDTPYNGGWPGGLDVLAADRYLVNDGYSVREIDSTGTALRTFYTYSPAVGDMYFGSFVRYNASNDTVYFGATTLSGKGELYSASCSGGSVRLVKNISGIFDIAFSGGSAYVVGGSGIYRVTDGETVTSTKVASVGNLQGGIAFDGDGNLYYAPGDLQTIFKWSAAQVAGAGNGVVLGGESAFAFDIPKPAYSLAFDGDGSLCFSSAVFGAPSDIWKYCDSTFVRSACTYDGTGSITNLAWNNFTGKMSAVTSVASGNYISDITLAVPEPGSMASLISLIGLAASASLLRRRGN